MTDKTEAQPEALRLAGYLERVHVPQHPESNGIQKAAAELRRQHTEIQQLKAEAQALAELLSDSLAPESKDWQAGSILDRVQFLLTMREASQQYCAELEAQLSARQAAPDGQWKCGNEYLPYHPDASHVDPAYRDGWNDCYRAAPPPPEQEPKCWCETCRPNTLSDMRFIVCSDCGNKRCPKATHHDNACTNSNAPGQPGSSWGHVKPHGATNDNP
ncbi:hypothetical protein [Comamonas koreensis]|uniref:Uncharacterized protein n=1 Tax=Comamonas koreensis TaxID=160825 RepID=A0AAW4XRX9_9BURK|nr:hypothetical protein [Comamonas koreensis]MCD2164333.1 hypothetical protein [Comamonas koreensis]